MEPTRPEAALGRRRVRTAGALAAAACLAGLAVAGVLFVRSKGRETVAPTPPAVALHVHIAGAGAGGGWPDVRLDGRPAEEAALQKRLQSLLRRDPDAAVGVSAPPDLPYGALQHLLIVFANEGLVHVRFTLPGDRSVAMRTWQQPITQPQGGVQIDVHLVREKDRTVARVAQEETADLAQALIDLLAPLRPRGGESDVVLHPKRDVPYLDAVTAYESATVAGFARVFFAVAE